MPDPQPPDLPPADPLPQKDPYHVLSIPSTFSDGQPFVLTLSVDNNDYYNRFDKCTLDYSYTDPTTGVIFQSEWQMIRCVKMPWVDPGPVDITVELLAKSPLSYDVGWFGSLLSPLPRSWAHRVLKFFGLRLPPANPGNGGVYGSNDQNGTARSATGVESVRGFRQHFEKESWLVKNLEETVKSFPIYEV